MTDYQKQQIEDINTRIAEAKKLLTDPSMADLVREEIEELEKQKAELEKSLSNEAIVANFSAECRRS